MREMTNRQIAARAGWRVVPYPADEAGTKFGFALEPTHIKDRDYFYAAVCDTADAAWARTPDYLGSVDAALSLCVQSGMAIEVHYRPGEPESEQWAASDAYAPETMWVVASTAAQAVCAAWVAWMDSKED